MKYRVNKGNITNYKKERKKRQKKMNLRPKTTTLLCYIFFMYILHIIKQTHIYSRLKFYVVTLQR